MGATDFGIGIVGAGFISRESHVPSLEYVPDAAVAAILNPTRSRAESLAETCRDLGVGDPALYGEHEVAELAADESVDGIWVTSPNDTRVDVVDGVVEAVEDGAAVDGIAMEKPVARNCAEVNRILDLVESVEISHAYLENWAYEPTIVKMRSLLWEGARGSGRPYIARANAEHSGPHSGWFWDGRKQGGGALTDMLCHALGGNEFLLSDPERGMDPAELTPETVSAETETLKWNQEQYAAQLREDFGVDMEENPVEDYARASVRYRTADDDRIVSEATGSWCYVGSGVNRRIELLGPEYSGQVVSDDAARSVFFSDAVADEESWVEKQQASSGRMPVGAADVVNSGYVAENRDAIRSFESGTNARVDLHDGARVIELCMAAYKSAEDGEDVALDSVSLEEYVPPPARE